MIITKLGHFGTIRDGCVPKFTSICYHGQVLWQQWRWWPEGIPGRASEGIAHGASMAFEAMTSLSRLRSAVGVVEQLLEQLTLGHVENLLRVFKKNLGPYLIPYGKVPPLESQRSGGR